MLGLLSGTLMLSLGIIGEYLGRLHVRSMQRPAFVVRPEPLPVRPRPGRSRRPPAPAGTTVDADAVRG